MVYKVILGLLAAQAVRGAILPRHEGHGEEAPAGSSCSTPQTSYTHTTENVTASGTTPYAVKSTVIVTVTDYTTVSAPTHPIHVPSNSSSFPPRSGASVPSHIHTNLRSNTFANYNTGAPSGGSTGVETKPIIETTPYHNTTAPATPSAKPTVPSNPGFIAIPGASTGPNTPLASASSCSHTPPPKSDMTLSSSPAANATTASSPFPKSSAAGSADPPKASSPGKGFTYPTSKAAKSSRPSSTAIVVIPITPSSKQLSAKETQSAENAYASSLIESIRKGAGKVLASNTLTRSTTRAVKSSPTRKASGTPTQRPSQTHKSSGTPKAPPKHSPPASTKIDSPPVKTIIVSKGPHCPYPYPGEHCGQLYTTLITESKPPKETEKEKEAKPIGWCPYPGQKC